MPRSWDIDLAIVWLVDLDRSIEQLGHCRINILAGESMLLPFVTLYARGIGQGSGIDQGLNLAPFNPQQLHCVRHGQSILELLHHFVDFGRRRHDAMVSQSIIEGLPSDALLVENLADGLGSGARCQCCRSYRQDGVLVDRLAKQICPDLPRQGRSDHIPDQLAQRLELCIVNRLGQDAIGEAISISGTNDATRAAFRVGQSVEKLLDRFDPCGCDAKALVGRDGLIHGGEGGRHDLGRM